MMGVERAEKYYRLSEEVEEGKEEDGGRST